jgi:hypothetical protein
MYRINRLNRNVLIIPDEVLFHIASDHDIDERQILQNIIVAEERFIANTLGDKLYEDFISKKNVVVTATNQNDLLTKINTSLTDNLVNNIDTTDIPIGTIINAIELVDNVDYVALWNRFLWKLTAECVDMMLIVPSWLRHTSAGQQLNNPKVIGGNNGGAASGDMKDVKFKMDIAIQDRIDPLIERMRLWICERKTKFPLYTKDCGTNDCSGSSDGNVPDGISYLRKTDIILGLYD